MGVLRCNAVVWGEDLDACAAGEEGDGFGEDVEFADDHAAAVDHEECWTGFLSFERARGAELDEWDAGSVVGFDGVARPFDIWGIGEGCDHAPEHGDNFGTTILDVVKGRDGHAGAGCHKGLRGDHEFGVVCETHSDG